MYVTSFGVSLNSSNMIASDRPLVNRLTCLRGLEQASPSLGIRNTVRPVLRGHRIKRTSCIKRMVAEVPKFFYFPFFVNGTFIKRKPLLSGRGHLKST